VAIIHSGYFVAAVVFEDGVVARAAPIVKYMMGWNRQKVSTYADKKGWAYAEY
jgi:hypothetical protein